MSLKQKSLLTDREQYVIETGNSHAWRYPRVMLKNSLTGKLKTFVSDRSGGNPIVRAALILSFAKRCARDFPECDICVNDNVRRIVHLPEIVTSEWFAEGGL